MRFSQLLLVTFLSLAAMVSTLDAQTVKVGIKAGLEGTSPVFASREALYRRAQHPLVIGPTVEVALPRAFAIEASALHKRVAFHRSEFFVFPEMEERHKETNADSWEVPLVLKKYIELGSFTRVYADVGFNLRHTGGTTHVTGYQLVRNSPGPPGPPSYRRTTFFSGREEDPAELDRAWNGGLVIGVGQEFKTGLLRLEPELRYTRWSNYTFRSPGDHLRSNRNSLDLLLGISFSR